MNKNLLIAGVLAVIMPGVALAQPDPNCVRSNDNSRVAGTVLGAGAGALIGSALAGRHSHGEGAVLGAVGGGVAGNVIAGQRNDPCPQGYYYPQGGPGYGPGPGPRGPGYGAGYYGSSYVPPRDEGYGRFWAGAPQDIGQRIEYMQARIQRMSTSGRLSPPESQRAEYELQSIRQWQRQRFSRNGGYLQPDDRGYIQARLDHLGQSLRWMRQTGY